MDAPRRNMIHPWKNSMELHPHQVAGKGVILVPFSEHVLKYTNEKEFENYKLIRDMPGIKSIVPEVCTAFKNDKSGAFQERFDNCDYCKSHFKDIFKRLTSLEPSRTYCLVMRDLTTGMVRPRVIDLKLGFRTFGEDKAIEKRAAAAAQDQNSSSADMGLRLCGCKRIGNDFFIKERRPQLDSARLSYLIWQFLPINSEQLQAILDEIIRMKEVIRGLNGWRFPGASILMCVDEDSPLFSIKLIDLAHTVQNGDVNTPDHGALYGVETLQDIVALKKVHCLIGEHLGRN